MHIITISDRDRNPTTTLHDTFQNVRSTYDINMDKKLWCFLDEYNTTLTSGKTARLPLRRLGDKLLTKIFTNIGFKGTNLLQLNICRLEKCPYP